MQTSGLKHTALSMYGRFIAVALVALFFVNSSLGQSAATPTTINITDTPKLKTAKRLGMNLGNQDFYDSGQFMRNLAFRNPGFEGEIWQSTIHCQSVTATSCTDDNVYTAWPANFLANAQVEFIVGAATGSITTVKSSTAAVTGVSGVTINFASLPVAPTVGDYAVVRMSVPGNAQSGWWTQGTSGTSFTTEFSDLSPNTPGKQALRVTQGASDQASVSSYMDSVPGRSFLQLNGSYTVFFRAKGTGGNNQMTVSFGRAVSNTPVTFFSKTITLTSGWQDYSYTFNAQDTGQIGALSLKFSLIGSSMLIDDVSLTAAAAANNPTVYRNEVLSTLQTLKPGILRFMDSGTNWGSTIDNMLQPDFARQRAGYSNWNSEMDNIPLGLHDYLVLCQTIGAEPWYTMPTGMTTQEMSNLIDYFGGSTSTVYGARRAALGQTAPWTSVFAKIHLEFGNEVWNTANPGASMIDPLAYGKRAGVIFTTAKASPSYNAKVFDLIQDGFAASASWTALGLSTSTNYDTVDAAPYTYNSLNDTSSTEAIYGPMFAEPEFNDSTTAGQTAQVAQAAAAANPAARLSVYEMNMGTNQGSATQAVVNSTAASAGAGITVADHALLMMRDLGVTDQNIFALPGLNAPFTGTTSASATTTPIWGVVVDMGGLTNLLRPMFLTEQMANNAILPTLLTTSQTGANPTWNQAYTTNDNFSLNGAHYIQSFAFTDGNKLNIILLNLSRTTALPVNFAGLNTPLGTAAISTLVSPSISSTNEASQTVSIQNTTQTLTSSSTLTLAPYSMTVVSVDAPVVPVLITSLTASCAKTSLSPAGSTTCTANVVGQGKYNTGVTWSVDNGTIDSNGNYTAPSAIPASGKATITATSVQDTTKKVTATVLIANNTVTGVTASCAVSTVGQGKQTTCTAAVSGTGGFSSAYTWSTTGGSITANGALTAPLTGTSVTVKATSTQDPTKSASVTLSVFPVLNLTTPQIATTSTSATISWALNMAANNGISYGTTPSVGTTTPPIALTSSPAITIPGLKPNTKYYFVVYSYINSQTVSQTLSVTTPGASTVSGVSVVCAATSLSASGATTCAASVAGTGSFSSAVNWSASAGTITSGGLFTAPTSGTSVTITATSAQDSTKSGSTTISLSQGLVINNPTVTATTTTATIGWSVNVPANNGVSYGVTPSGGTTTPPMAALTSTPAMTITGLTPNTKYYFVIYSYLNSQTVSQTLSVTTAAAATVTGVSVKCAATSVAAGATTTCTPAVTGTSSFSSAVTWSTSAGSITSAGVLTAPATGTSVTVTATSTQDATKSGSAVITITPTITAVSISCGATSVKAGATTTCTPTVTGKGNYSSAVTWSTSAGSITSAGVLTAPATGTSVTVTATSTQDTTKSSSATITIAPTVAAVSVACAATTVTGGTTTTCTPAVTGTGNFSSAVTWSTSAGSITSAGVLTAPTTGTSVTVTATSTQDTTKSGSATIALNQALTISNLATTTTTTTATISWSLNMSANNGISYGTTPSVGTTTPAFAMTSSPTITLTGLSPNTKYYLVVYSFVGDQNTQKTITLTTAAAGTVTAVSVICAPTSVTAGATTTCTPTVTGTGRYSTAVTWSASAGSISAAGLLTAPMTGNSVTVTATSVLDSTKSASTTIAVTPALPLAITGTTFSATPTTIVVSWKVTQPSHSGVDYGVSYAYGGTTPWDNNLSTSPSYTLTGLKPGTTYYLLNVSISASGEVVSHPITVTTPLQ